MVSDKTHQLDWKLKKAVAAYGTAPEYSTFKKTAEAFEIPCWETLRNRVKGTGSKIDAVEKRQLLSNGEEKELFAHCASLADRNFPVTLATVQQFAEVIVARKSELSIDEVHIGKHWKDRLLKRWSEFETKFSHRLNHARALANDQELLKDFYVKMGIACEMHQAEPQNIYNLDEKGFRMGIASLSKVIVRKHANKHDSGVSEDHNRETVTVLECIAADGYVARPCIIFKGKGHNYGWYPIGFEGKKYSFGISNNGWIDTILYFDWLRKIFEPSTRARAGEKWRLLVVDGLKEHINLEIIEFCYKHKILVICLPPNATHLLQPLDVGVFATYQHFYGQEVDRFSRIGIEGIGKQNFLKFLIPARDKTFDPERGLAARAFQAAGVWPVDPERYKDRFPPPPDFHPAPPKYPQPLKGYCEKLIQELSEWADNYTTLPEAGLARKAAGGIGQLFSRIENLQAQLSCKDVLYAQALAEVERIKGTVRDWSGDRD